VRVTLHGGPLDGEVVGINTTIDHQEGVPLYYDVHIPTDPSKPNVGHWHRWLRMNGPDAEPYVYEYYGEVGPTGPAHFWDKTG
jgi:hypothetical protein